MKRAFLAAAALGLVMVGISSADARPFRNGDRFGSMTQSRSGHGSAGMPRDYRIPNRGLSYSKRDFHFPSVNRRNHYNQVPQSYDIHAMGRRNCY